MRSHGTALSIGALFGAGLVVSGMAVPTRVIGFLNVAGAWDPTLLFVMASAVGVYALVSPRVLRRQKPLFSESFGIPKNRKIDRDLVLGAALFGVGWGLAGYCPGPALVALGAPSSEVVTFAVTMTVGMLLHSAMKKEPKAEPLVAASTPAE